MKDQPNIISTGNPVLDKAVPIRIYEQLKLMRLIHYLLNDIEDNPTITIYVDDGGEFTETVHEHPGPLELVNIRGLTFLYQ